MVGLIGGGKSEEVLGLLLVWCAGVGRNFCLQFFA